MNRINFLLSKSCQIGEMGHMFGNTSILLGRAANSLYTLGKANLFSNWIPDKDQNYSHFDLLT